MNKISAASPISERDDDDRKKVPNTAVEINVGKDRVQEIFNMVMNPTDTIYSDREINRGAAKEIIDLIQVNKGKVRAKASTCLLVLVTSVRSEAEEAKTLETLLYCLASEHEEDRKAGWGSAHTTMITLLCALVHILKTTGNTVRILPCKVKIDKSSEPIGLLVLLREMIKVYRNNHVMLMHIGHVMVALFSDRNLEEQLRKSGGTTLLAMLLREDNDEMLLTIMPTLCTIACNKAMCRALCEAGAFPRLLDCIMKSKPLIRRSALQVISVIVTYGREDTVILNAIKNEIEAAHTALNCIAAFYPHNSPVNHQGKECL
jgi:hypothetical protein